MVKLKEMAQTQPSLLSPFVFAQEKKRPQPQTGNTQPLLEKKHIKLQRALRKGHFQDYTKSNPQVFLKECKKSNESYLLIFLTTGVNLLTNRQSKKMRNFEKSGSERHFYESHQKNSLMPLFKYFLFTTSILHSKFLELFCSWVLPYFQSLCMKNKTNIDDINVQFMKCLFTQNYVDVLKEHFRLSPP